MYSRIKKKYGTKINVGIAENITVMAKITIRDAEIISFEDTQLNFIAEIKLKVRQAQYEAMQAVNVQLVNLYWEIGKSITEKQKESWGKAVVPKLSEELQKEFPGVSGYSVTNLWLMAQFYAEYHNVTNLQPLVGEISWTKHVIILNRCKDNLERQFYTQATKKFGWTKNVLIHQIEGKSYEKYLLSRTICVAAVGKTYTFLLDRR